MSLHGSRDLPIARRLRILLVLGTHPTVEGETHLVHDCTDRSSPSWTTFARSAASKTIRRRTAAAVRFRWGGCTASTTMLRRSLVVAAGSVRHNPVGGLLTGLMTLGGQGWH